MNYQQLDIFTGTLPKLKLEGKDIYLIECFAGIGSQYSALKVLERYSGNKFKVISHKIVEWAFNSYVMYNQLHIKDYKDYSADKTKEEMIDRIRGTSLNYNEPLDDKKLYSKPLKWLKEAYNSCVATNNLVNIMNVKGTDLEINKDKNKLYCLTYSFPCQDISLAGLGKGLEKSQADGGTRSGLLWEIERILDELDNRERERELSTLPDILLMENVPPLLSSANGNIKQFQKWEQKLASLGYSNFVKILNAKDYGIPQNRERVFMISILGDYTYNFPAKIPLKHKLKDFLESNVDEKYYLTDKATNYICGNALNKNLKDRINRSKTKLNKQIAYTINTKQDRRNGDANFILDGYDEISINDYLQIRNNTQKSYLCAKEGDGINISTHMHQQRGNVQKDNIQTIKTQIEVGVVVNDNAYICDDRDKGHNGIRVLDECPTQRASRFGLKVVNNLRIRKLLPSECLKLMGFSRENYDSIKEWGDNAIYHCAGDSIVVTVLMALFGELTDLDYRKIINDYIESEVINNGL